MIIPGEEFHHLIFGWMRSSVMVCKTESRKDVSGDRDHIPTHESMLCSDEDEPAGLDLQVVPHV